MNVLPPRPETGDGKEGSGGGWPAGAAAPPRRNPILFLFFFRPLHFPLYFSSSSPMGKGGRSKTNAGSAVLDGGAAPGVCTNNSLFLIFWFPFYFLPFSHF